MPLYYPVFPIKNLAGRYCLSPFVSIHVQSNGAVNMCTCPIWQPIVAGNILKESLGTILSSDLATDIRKSIIDGTYRYCNEKHCPLMLNDSLNTFDTVPDNVKELLQDPSKYITPYEISLNGDRTCNLSCPSCRTSVINLSKKERESEAFTADTLYKNLIAGAGDAPIHLIPGATGEIFASGLMLSLLEKLNVNELPNLKITLHTNGLLAAKKWYKIQHLNSAIKNVTVSIDASTKETYEVVRRGGIWEELLENLEFIRNKKAELGFSFNSRLIFQQKNFKEAVDFYHLSKSYNIDRVEYSRICNRGTFTPKEFLKEDVLQATNPERSAAMLVVKDLTKLSDVWFEGDFS